MNLKLEKDKIILSIKKLITNKDEIEQYFKYIIRLLKKHYKIDLKGLYNVIIYTDEFWGSIIEIENENIDYYNNLDLEIKIISNSKFLYQIDFNVLNKNQYVYKLNSNFYVDEIKDNNVEFVKVIYGDKSLEILKKCKRVKI